MSDILGTAGMLAGMVGDDAVTLGTRVLSNTSPSEPKPIRLKQPRAASGLRRRAGSTPALPTAITQPIIKQEAPVTTAPTPTKAELQAAVDENLRKFVEAAKTPEAQSEVLINIQMFKQELDRQDALLKSVDPALRKQVRDEWLALGHADLKGAVWNAKFGNEEIPLIKMAPAPVAEETLAKMVAGAPNDNARSHMLAKMGALTREVVAGLQVIEKEPLAKQEAMANAWVNADPADAVMRKNILDAEMGRQGKKLYGAGVQAGQVVKDLVGNASTASSAQLGGSQDGAPGNIAASIKKPGGPSAMPGSDGVMPDAGGVDTPNPGSGPNDTGDGAVKPAKLIRRKPTTGGLGNVSGAGTGGGGSRVNNSDASGAGTGKKAEKAEFIEGLVKYAPDEMIEALAEEVPERQVELCEMVADQAADLIAWMDRLDPDVLQKRDMDAAIEEWLSADPETIQMKKWTAEALATGEIIPMELAKTIMEWEPMVTVKIRQPFATAA